MSAGQASDAATFIETEFLNLVDGQVEVYTEPTGDVPDPDYGRLELYGPDAAVPFTLGGREVALLPVRDLLPPSVLRRAETA